MFDHSGNASVYVWYIPYDVGRASTDTTMKKNSTCGPHRRLEKTPRNYGMSLLDVVKARVGYVTTGILPHITPAYALFFTWLRRGWGGSVPQVYHSDYEMFSMIDVTLSSPA